MGSIHPHAVPYAPVDAGEQSRFLAVVLGPEALASPWVGHEVEHFLRERPTRDVILLRRRACDVPARLHGAVLIDWPPAADAAAARAQLLDALCPAADDMAQYQRRHDVRRSWRDARWTQPDGLDPAPTPQNTALCELLLAPDIGDLDQEGLALVGFDTVGELVAELDVDEAYGTKMVLGELLAVAVLRDRAYARVLAGYVRRDGDTGRRTPFLVRRNRLLRGATDPACTTNLLFAVARAGSKLAEIDSGRVPLSTMWAVLDRRMSPASPNSASSMRCSRTPAAT